MLQKFQCGMIPPHEAALPAASAASSERSTRILNAAGMNSCTCTIQNLLLANV